LIKIGTCGWTRIYQYAPPSIRAGKSSLQSYAYYFDTVEINSSFYSLHKKETYKKWREEVSPDFDFTIKCHRNVTHKNPLKIDEEALSAFQSIVEGAKACNAKAILIQTPPSFKPGKDAFLIADKFFSSIDSKGVPLVWETRGEEWFKDEVKVRLRELLQKYGVTHVTDILKREPVYIHQLAYFRLHGMPRYNLKYSYTNEELETILAKAKIYERKENFPVFIFFNNYAMYSDAARLKLLMKEEELPISPFGAEALRVALHAFEEWPVTRERLMEVCGGWNVWIQPNKIVKVGDLLKRLKERRYNDVEDLIREARDVLKGEI